MTEKIIKAAERLLRRGVQPDQVPGLLYDSGKTEDMMSGIVAVVIVKRREKAKKAEAAYRRRSKTKAFRLGQLKMKHARAKVGLKNAIAKLRNAEAALKACKKGGDSERER